MITSGLKVLQGPQAHPRAQLFFKYSEKYCGDENQEITCDKVIRGPVL